MQKNANLCIMAGVVILVIAVTVRLVNLVGLVSFAFHDLWELSSSLFLLAIALGVNKK